MAVEASGPEDDTAGNRSAVIVRLLACTDTGSLLHALIETARSDFGARTGAAYLVQDDGWLRMAAAIGVDQAVVDRHRLVPPDHNLPVAEVVRTRSPVYVSTEAAYAAYPSMSAMGSRDIVFVALPLLVDERCLGAIFFSFAAPRAVGRADRIALSAMVSVGAHRLEHLLAFRRPDNRAADKAAGMLEPRARMARLDLAMSASSTGAFDRDLITGKLLWDEQMCRIFGFEPSEFDDRSETFFARIHPDDLKLMQNGAAEAARAGYDYRQRYRFIRRSDGALRWLETKGRVLTDPAGHPLRTVGIAYDCTEEQEREAEERALQNARRERSRFTLRVTRALSQALTVDEVVAVMTSTALHGLRADALAIHLDDGGNLRLAGAAGYGRSALEQLRSLDRSARSPMARAQAAGAPLFFDRPATYQAAFPRGGHGYEPDQGAWAVLPLTAADHLLGTCLIAFRQEHKFTAEDRAHYTAMAGILAQALERAKLFDRERRRVTELQRVMLPRRLPELPGLAIAARYLPGSDGMEVGGDWYDVLPLPDRRVGLIIGDVQGHSTRAAAVMGQLRIALRAYASEGHDPATLMASTNRLLCGLGTELFATCCYVELNRMDGTARVVRAGHCHPLLVDAQGKAMELVVPGGLPLGLDAAEEYPFTRVVLDPGALLLLHTDGLVESRGREYTEAVNHLLTLLHLWAVPPDGPGGQQHRPSRHNVQRLADRIIGPAAARTAREDDIALLLVRRTPDPDAAPPLMAEWQINAGDLRALADARRKLRRQLVGWGLSEISGDAELMAAELMSNAVLHAGGDIELTARLDGGVLRVEVLDSSTHRPRLVAEENGLRGYGGTQSGQVSVSGRGMRLVDAWADRWGWEPLGDRKAVWFELRTGEEPTARL